MANDRPRRLWKFCEAIALTMSTISFFSGIFLPVYFVNTRPCAPVPSAGRIYFHDVHGQIAYLSAFEYRSLDVLFVLALFAFIVFAFIEQYKHPFR